MDLRLIRPSHVEAWVESMTVATATRKRPLAPGTIKTRFVNVRSVFRAAVRDGMIAVDPTTQVRLPRLRRREAAMTIPTPEVVHSILEPSEPRFRAFVGLCAFAGLRLGETAALQIGDIDFLRRQVHVRRQVQRLNGSFEIRLPKYNSERTVHVPDALLQMLSEHVALGLPYDWLFAEVEDVPPHQNTIGYRWRSTLQLAGVADVRMHDLRHFYASGLIASGCDVVAVQRALGHAKPVRRRSGTITRGFGGCWSPPVDAGKYGLTCGNAIPGLLGVDGDHRSRLDFLRTICGLGTRSPA